MRFGFFVFLLLIVVFGCINQNLAPKQDLEDDALVQQSDQDNPSDNPLVPTADVQENNPPPELPPQNQQQSNEPQRVENKTVFGEISTDQIWAGEILVTDWIIVKEGVTLVIEPGTKVKFKHNRDYKNPLKTGLEVHGNLTAIGTPEKQIFFTSDVSPPQNGDWGMLRLFGKTSSKIKYAVVEFAQQGINLWKSDAEISHSIVRWNNWEGLYAESFSTPLIEYNMVYQNGYNGMAMEQFNDVVVINNLFEKSGTHGLHVDASKAVVENNLLKENGAAGLSLDDAAEVSAKNNSLIENRIFGIMCGEGENKLSVLENKAEQENATNCPGLAENDFEGSGAAEIAFDFVDTKTFDLGYTPGDQQKDKYLYVYPDDQTRKIVKKMGANLGLTWSIALEGKDVWTSTVSGDIYKLEGQTGQVLKQFKAPSSQPWGMAFDGKDLWITDFAEKRTYSLDTQSGDEKFSFQNPDQEHGAKGLTWDGQNLYIMGWTTNTIYKMKRDGEMVETILLDYGAGGGLAFDGTSFWVPCDVICRFSTDGHLIGKIYPASEGTWDLEWEPAQNSAEGFLWATQRTNENWQDEKIFKIEVLDDKIIK